MKKLKFLVLAALLLALLFTGCDSGGGGDSDTWTFASPNQLSGSWTGSNTITKSIKEWAQIWEWDWDPAEMDSYLGNMSLKSTWDVIMNVNNSGQITGTNKTTYVFSGGNINNASVWEDIKSSYTSADSANDSNHSLIFSDPISLTYYEGDTWIQINQNGKKIKVQSNQDGVPIDMILNKQ